MAIKDATARLVSKVFGEPSSKPATMLKIMLPLRGFAILCVVLAHASITMLAAEVSLAGGLIPFSPTVGRWEVAAFPKSMALEFSRFAVPMFLFLAGYASLSMPRTWKAVWSISRKLLAPMLFWSLVALAISWRKGSGGWSLEEFIIRLATGKAQIGFFFILLVVQYYVLARWLVPAVGKRPVLVLLVSFALQFATQVYDYLYLAGNLGFISSAEWLRKAGSFPEFLFPRFIGSYVLGIWAATYSKKFRDFVTSRFGAICLAGAIAAAFLVLERGLLFYYARRVLGLDPYGATALSWVEWKFSSTLWTFLATLMLVGAFLKRVPVKSFLEYLGKNSLHIFILHGIILEVLTMVLYKYFGAYRFYGCLGTAFLLLGGLLGSLLITRVARFLPGSIRTMLIGS